MILPYIGCQKDKLNKLFIQRHLRLFICNISRSLRLGTKWFTCRKWFIGYNFGKDDGAESKFGTHKELILLNIFKYICCANKAHDMSRVLLKIVNYWPIGGRFKKRNRAITFFQFTLNISDTSSLELPSIALQHKIMRENIILNA